MYDVHDVCSVRYNPQRSDMFQTSNSWFISGFFFFFFRFVVILYYNAICAYKTEWEMLYHSKLQNKQNANFQKHNSMVCFIPFHFISNETNDNHCNYNHNNDNTATATVTSTTSAASVIKLINFHKLQHRNAFMFNFLMIRPQRRTQTTKRCYAVRCVYVINMRLFRSTLMHKLSSIVSSCGRNSKSTCLRFAGWIFFSILKPFSILYRSV